MNTYKVYIIGRETPIVITARKCESIPINDGKGYIFYDDKCREVCRIEKAHIITIVIEYAE